MRAFPLAGFLILGRTSDTHVLVQTIQGKLAGLIHWGLIVLLVLISGWGSIFLSVYDTWHDTWQYRGISFMKEVESVERRKTTP